VVFSSHCGPLWLSSVKPFRLLELDTPSWAGNTAAIVCQPRLGASLRKGWFRIIGTPVGAVAIVVLTAGFPQDPCLSFIGLALWGAACAFVSTILQNFAAMRRPWPGIRPSSSPAISSAPSAA
jgi:uncharacterized membrane protein YccC